MQAVGYLGQFFLIMMPPASQNTHSIKVSSVVNNKPCPSQIRDSNVINVLFMHLGTL